MPIQNKNTLSVEEINDGLREKYNKIGNKVEDIQDILKKITFPYNHLVKKDTVSRRNKKNPPWGNYIQDVKTIKRGEIVEVTKAELNNYSNYGMFTFGMGDPFVQLILKDGSYIAVNVADLKKEEETKDEVFVEATEENVKTLEKEIIKEKITKNVNKNKYIYAIVILLGGYLLYKKFKK